MINDSNFITRRSFIKAAAPCLALGLRHQGSGQTAVEREQLTETDLAECRRQLLELVNIERGLASVAPLALDEFACQVESRHALDMATGKFLSHWGSDGLKPYQRYSLAGGTDYTQENVSATDQIPSLKPERIADELIGMNIRMHAEKPPDDGHRRAILAPDATHVGFGVALNGKSLRLAEMFIARHTDIEPLPRRANRKGKLVIKGRLLNREYIFQQADVFYERLPAPQPDRLVINRRYSLPDEFVTLRPILAVRVHYADGTTGTIDVGSHGKFSVPVTLFKGEPGIYTIVLWIKRKQKEKGFPATEICIRAD